VTEQELKYLDLNSRINGLLYCVGNMANGFTEDELEQMKKEVSEAMAALKEILDIK
jgi:hypothetical protein